MQDFKDNIENEEIQKSFRRTGLVVFITAAASILFFFILYRIDSFRNIVDSIVSVIRPVIYGLVMAYILNPIMVYFQRMLTPFFVKRMKVESKAKKTAKMLSIIISVLIGLIVITGFILLIIPSLYESIVSLASTLPGQVQDVVDNIISKLKTENIITQNLGFLLENTTDFLEKWISTNLMPTLNNVITYVTTSIVAIVMFLVNFFIGIIVAIYALNEKEKFIGQSKMIVYALFNPKKANIIIDTARHGNKIFGGFLTGRLVDSLIVWVITVICLWIMDMPYVMLVSVIIGVTNIIPFFGPFIGAIPSAALILLDSPRKGLVFIIFIIILQQIDGNIIGPWALKNSTGVTEFWVTFALLLFGGIFGFTGMMIGVPLFSVIYYITKMYIGSKLDKKDLPTKSSAYVKVDEINEETSRLVYHKGDYYEEEVTLKDVIANAKRKSKLWNKLTSKKKKIK